MIGWWWVQVDTGLCKLFHDTLQNNLYNWLTSFIILPLALLVLVVISRLVYITQTHCLFYLSSASGLGETVDFDRGVEDVLSRSSSTTRTAHWLSLRFLLTVFYLGLDLCPLSVISSTNSLLAWYSYFSWCFLLPCWFFRVKVVDNIVVFHVLLLWDKYLYTYNVLKLIIFVPLVTLQKLITNYRCVTNPKTDLPFCGEAL